LYIIEREMDDLPLFETTRFFSLKSGRSCLLFYISSDRDKPVLRGRLWDKEKV